MPNQDEEEISTRLKEGIDLSELRNPQGQGVEFEVDDDQLNKTGEEENRDLRSFDRNQVISNICLMSDDEDDDSDNANSDEPYLTEIERLRNRMLQKAGSDITPNKDGGVLKQLKTRGIGGGVPEGALVKVHYNAYTDVGQPPYDSTRLRGEELKVRLGKGQIIPGLELAIMSMKKNELSRFLIRHDYAYGKYGCPPRIPPEATLIFDIEVLHFVEQEGVDDYYSLTPEERRTKLKYSDIEKVVKAENAEAKEYFDNKNYHSAFGKYKRSVGVLESYHLKNAEDERQWKQQLLRAYVNCAICCFNLHHFRPSITYCNLALGIDRNCIKALFFKGKALHSEGSFEDARTVLKKARNLSPKNHLISKALQKLAESMNDYEVFEKSMCAKMFAGSRTDVQPPEQPSADTAQTKEKVTGEDHGSCSDAFRAQVKEQLQKFQQDSSMIEMPFPKISLSPAEIECILEVALSLGMDVRQRGTGSSIRYAVYKKPVKP